MSSSGPTYRPDMQVMTLPADLEAGLDPNQPDIQLTPSGKAIVFHEWIHYLHNVSTIHGLASLSVLLKLWSNFRDTFWNNDWSVGKTPRLAGYLDDIDADLRYMAGSRGAQSNQLPENLLLSEIQFIEVKLLPPPAVMNTRGCSPARQKSTGIAKTTAHKSSCLLAPTRYSKELRISLRSSLPPP